MSFDRALFSAAIQSHMLEHGLSVREAAKESGVSPSTISRIANGEVPDIESFTLLVTWLKIDANAFVHNSDSTSILTEQEQWTWLYRCLQDLEVSKELIDAIVVVIRVIKGKKESSNG